MTGTPIPFIGRADALEIVHQLITEYGKVNVLCLGGDGGIGKTRLLQETHRRYSVDSNFIVPSILDFDTPYLQVPDNLELEIARQLRDTHFQVYLQRLRDWRQMQQAGISYSRLVQEEQVVREAFDTCYKSLSQEHRIVLLMDTIEDIQGSSVWDNIVDLIRRATNTLFMLSGRCAEDVYKILVSQFGNEMTHLYTLGPLSPSEANTYIEAKEAQLRTPIDAGIRERLVRVAGKKPILIDLACEWIARSIPMEWLLNVTLEDLDKLPPDRYQDFETQLVKHIGQLRKPLDELILDMAYVYPMDKEMAMLLLDITPDQQAELFQELDRLVFVKPFPNGAYALHDEMRRMINAYVWESIDPKHTRRRQISRQVTEYFHEKASALRIQLEQYDDARSTLDTFAVKDVVQRSYWLIREQQFSHQLWADLDKGHGLFLELFEETTQGYQFALRSTLLDYIESFTEALSSDQLYDVRIRRVRSLLDLSSRKDIDQAGQILETLMETYADDSERELDMLTRLANCLMKSGKAPLATSYLEKALDISKRKAVRWLGTIYNTLGQHYRLLQRFNRARAAYMEALALTKDEQTKASIYNNLGYVIALQEGRQGAALKYCEQSLATRQRLDLKREVGMSYATLGNIYRSWGENEKAMEQYNEALKVFEPAEDREWLAIVYAYRGALRRLTAETPEEFSLAVADLERSIEQNIITEIAYAKHVLGCVYKGMGDFNKALTLFDESGKLAKELSDVRNHVNNLVTSSEIYIQQWMRNPLPDYRDKILCNSEVLEKYWQDGYRMVHQQGRMLRVLGDLAYVEARFDDARDYYAQAYPFLSTRYAGYARRTFNDELHELENRIASLPPELALAWCDYLESIWVAPGQVAFKSEDLLSLCHIQRTEARFKLMGSGEISLKTTQENK